MNKRRNGRPQRPPDVEIAKPTIDAELARERATFFDPGYEHDRDRIFAVYNEP